MWSPSPSNGPARTTPSPGPSRNKGAGEAKNDSRVRLHQRQPGPQCAGRASSSIWATSPRRSLWRPARPTRTRARCCWSRRSRASYLHVIAQVLGAPATRTTATTARSSTTDVRDRVPDLKVTVVTPEAQAFSGEKTLVTLHRHQRQRAHRLAADQVLDRPDLPVEGPDLDPESAARDAAVGSAARQHAGWPAAPATRARSRSRCRAGIEGTYYLYVFTNTATAGDIPQVPPTPTVPFPVVQGDGVLRPRKGRLRVLQLARLRERHQQHDAGDAARDLPRARPARHRPAAGRHRGRRRDHRRQLHRHQRRQPRHPRAGAGPTASSCPSTPRSIRSTPRSRPRPRRTPSRPSTAAPTAS